MRAGSLVVAAIAVLGITGCAPLHYQWAYTPLYDARGEMFRPPEGELDYRELADAKAMVEAEREMYRKGYVMVGYVNMLSPQMEGLAPGFARQHGADVGASAVLQIFGDRHYLATFWARPKHYVLGAYYGNDMPDQARAALKGALKVDGGVVVETVVADSPADRAGLKPGDLLVSVNQERIGGAAELDRLLRKHQGAPADFIVWSMMQGAPRVVTVELGSLK